MVSSLIRWRWAALAWLASTLGLGLFFATHSPGLRTYRIGTPADAHLAVDFWTREDGSEGPYRWTKDQSRLHFHGYERFPALLTLLRVQAPGPFSLSAGPAALDIPASGSPEWRVYRVFTPRPEGWEMPAARIASPVTTPGDGDGRQIGIVLSAAGVQPLGSAALLAVVQRTAFVGLLLLIGLLLAGRSPWRRWLALLPPALAAGVIAATVIAPAATSYWLPQLWASALLLLGLLLLPALSGLGGRLSGPARLWAGAGLAALGAALLAVQHPALLWPGAALLLGGALLAANAPAATDTESVPAPFGRRVLLLGGVVALAALARLAWLDTIPFGLWRDEAKYGLVALNIARDAGYRPVYVPGGVDYPALLMYLIAFVGKFSGIGVLTLRLAAALAGALTPLALYAFGRRLVGPGAALAAALFVAVAAWHVAISRISFVAVLEPLFTLTGLALLWSALLMERGGRRRWLWFGAAGLAFGLSLYTYHTARIVPLVALLLLFVVLGRSAARWRAQLGGLALAAVVAGALLAPLARYAITNSAEFNARVEQTSVVAGAERESLPAPAALDQNIGRYALMWHVRGEPNGRHYLPGRPMLDPLVGALFALGLIGLLARRRTPSERFLLAWLALELVPPLLAEGAPHAVRSVGAIAPALLLAGLAMQRLLAACRTPLGRRALAGAVGGAVAAFNLWLYFGHVPYDRAVWDKFYVTDTMMALYARSSAGAPVALPRETMQDDVGQYLLADVAVQTWDPERAPALASGAEILLPYGATDAQRDWALAHSDGAPPRPMRPFPGTDTPTFWVYRAR